MDGSQTKRSNTYAAVLLELFHETEAPDARRVPHPRIPSTR